MRVAAPMPNIATSSPAQLRSAPASRRQSQPRSRYGDPSPTPPPILPPAPVFVADSIQQPPPPPGCRRPVQTSSPSSGNGSVWIALHHYVGRTQPASTHSHETLLPTPRSPLHHDAAVAHQLPLELDSCQ